MWRATSGCLRFCRLPDLVAPHGCVCSMAATPCGVESAAIGRQGVMANWRCSCSSRCSRRPRRRPHTHLHNHYLMSSGAQSLDRLLLRDRRTRLIVKLGWKNALLAAMSILWRRLRMSLLGVADAACGAAGDWKLADFVYSKLGCVHVTASNSLLISFTGNIGVSLFVVYLNADLLRERIFTELTVRWGAAHRRAQPMVGKINAGVSWSRSCLGQQWDFIPPD